MKKIIIRTVILVIIFLVFISYLFNWEQKKPLQKKSLKKTVISFDNLKYTIYDNFKDTNNFHSDAYKSLYNKETNTYFMQINELKTNYRSFEHYKEFKLLDNKANYKYVKSINNKYQIDIFRDEEKNYYMYFVYLESKSYYIELSLWSDHGVYDKLNEIINSVEVKL